MFIKKMDWQPDNSTPTRHNTEQDKTAKHRQDPQDRRSEHETEDCKAGATRQDPREHGARQDRRELRTR